VPFPDPQPGLVIRYAYLWRSEEARGRDESTKDRPCAVVLATRRDDGRLIVVVAPITHASPHDPTAAIEVPVAVKARLRLDNARSWIVTSEVNFFTWPGPDLRPVDPGDRTLEFAYGYLPRGLAKAVVDGVREQMRMGLAKVVKRDEP
jgi:mRNA-degrading endonuclease toxin of MazEF toxin-antitoxin module